MRSPWRKRRDFLTQARFTPKMIRDAKSRWHMLAVTTCIWRQCWEHLRSHCLGARQGFFCWLVDDGLLKRFPRPDVAVALHDTNDFPAGKVGVGLEYIAASSDSLRITIYGKGGHGARPNTTIGPVKAEADAAGAPSAPLIEPVCQYGPFSLSVLFTGRTERQEELRPLAGEVAFGVSASLRGERSRPACGHSVSDG